MWVLARGMQLGAIDAEDKRAIAPERVPAVLGMERIVNSWGKLRARNDEYKSSYELADANMKLFATRNNLIVCWQDGESREWR
jgi:hypothetical protein